ncbi:Nucleic-acid-binding protein from transposon X-element [Eumeta japonica]|uniref:Nucleic-acid-binding protein from transposon X-element n=1 Tax=Eumeta variegata TaxID=151549 RepID=A0A4C1Y8Q8_EUMVA|nr:Nucleic-acid-binding protein from transposon X-element [Eumeta japonica]
MLSYASRIPARRAPRIRPTDPRRLLFAPTNNRRLIRHLRDSRQLYDQTRTLTMDQDSPCSPGAGGSGSKTSITLEFIQQVLTKALSEIGYEAPQDVVKKLIARVTPVSRSASSRATSPMKTNKNKNKRQASSSSDEGATCSDSIVVGSNSESENSNTSFTLVEGKNKRTLRKALKKAKVARDQPEMDIDPSSAPTSRANDAKPSPVAVQQTQTTVPPDCTRLRINCKPSAPPTTALKFTAQTLRLSAVSIYISWTLKSNFTRTPSRRRKLKAVIRGIPTDFPVDEIQADLRPGLPVHSVHRLCRRDGSPLWLVLAVLPRTEEAKNIFNNLNMVCGLSGIRVEAPHKKGGPGQCHRCQLYSHAAANCHADPCCVKCLVPHWARECPRTRESGAKSSCVNCLQQHTANYRGCPKALKFISYNRPNPNRPKSRPVAPPRDLNNFLDLAETNQPPAAASRPASNPWGKPKPAATEGRSGTVRAVRREPPVSLPASATAGTSSFGDDIQTVMSILHAVKSSEISEFARDFRACSNVEEKLMVLVRYHYLMVKLESI